MKLQLIRNATLRLEYNGKCLLVDPFLAPKHSLPTFAGNSENPTVDLPIQPERVMDGVDAVIITHLHPDHFDERAQEILPKSLPIFCQPNDDKTIVEKGFANCTVVDQPQLFDGIQLTPTKAQHGSGEWLERMGDVSGFLIEADGFPSVYLAADTILIPAVTNIIADKRPDIIVTNSGGANIEGTLIIMDAEQTLAVCEAAPWATVVAVHLESLDHCPVTREMLKAGAVVRGITNLQVPDDGETLEIA